MSLDCGRVWQQMPLCMIPSTLPVPEEVLTAACVANRVLDVGCGVGSVAAELNMEALAAWVGVDVNRAAIHAARKTLPPHTRFIEHDVRQPLSGVGQFDLVLFKGILTCLPTQKEQLQVLRNAVARGAKQRVFVVVDFLQNWDHPVYRRRYEHGLRAGLEKGTFLVRDTKAPVPAYLAHHFEYPELIRLLTASGLCLVCSRNIPVRTRSGNETVGFVLIAS